MNRSNRNRNDIRRSRRPKIAAIANRFLVDEEGSAYSLAMTMSLPFYVLLIAVFIETTLLMTVKLGVQYAAYAATRAAAVWMPANIPEDQRLGMIHLAVIHALLPFASGSEDHTSLGTANFTPLECSDAVLQAGYERFAADPRDREYMQRKWTYAANNSSVRVHRESNEFNSPITVTVEYDRPFFIAAVGMIFGTRTKSGAYTRTLSHSVTLPAAGSKAADVTLGIQYDRSYGFASTAAKFAPQGPLDK